MEELRGRLLELVGPHMMGAFIRNGLLLNTFADLGRVTVVEFWRLRISVGKTHILNDVLSWMEEPGVNARFADCTPAELRATQLGYLGVPYQWGLSRATAALLWRKGVVSMLLLDRLSREDWVNLGGIANHRRDEIDCALALYRQSK